VARIRALVVDDSRFMVSLISSILDASGEIEVVGFALDGEQAVEQARKLVPDVITMDVVMPRMDGIEATRTIVRELAIPIVIFSAHTQQGAATAIDALAAGAVDCIAKPAGERSMSLGETGAALVRKLVEVVGGVSGPAPRPQAAPGSALAAGNAPAVVAIGASTGGIAALSVVLPHFPASVPFPVLVVQHFPRGFTASLAQKLDSMCSMSVGEAEPGQMLAPGYAIVAPGGMDMEVTTGRRARVSAGQGPGVLRPSVDVTFRSVARVFGPACVAVVLSGMGRDGAEGVREVGRAGGRVVVQDPATATAWGMPSAAIDTGFAEAVLPLERIGSYLLTTCRGS